MRMKSNPHNIMREGTSKKLVPELRFPEFVNDREWDEDVFGQLFTYLPNNTLSRAELTDKRGRIQNIHYGDVLIKFSDVLDAQKECLPSIFDAEKIKNIETSRLQDGDIVIADTAEDDIVGKCTEVINVNDSIIVSGLHTIPCRPNTTFAKGYLGHYMNSNAFHHLLRPLMQGAKVSSISKYGLKSISFTYPHSRDEQKNIVQCLSSIDKLVVETKSKVEQLKEHKKGLLQTLFPPKDKTLPELRFPEFINEEEWKETSIEKQCPVRFSGGTPNTSKMQYYGGDIPFIRSAEIASNKTELTLTQAGIENSSAKIVSKGDILIALYGANSGDVAIAKISGAINQAILCLRPICVNGYLYHFLSQNKSYIIDKYLQGGQGNLSGEIIRSIKFPLPPSKEEQQKITFVLSSIDDMIEQYDEKVKALKLHKKGLMQKLFPNNNKYGNY